MSECRLSKFDEWFGRSASAWTIQKYNCLISSHSGLPGMIRSSSSVHSRSISTLLDFRKGSVYSISTVGAGQHASRDREESQCWNMSILRRLQLTLFKLMCSSFSICLCLTLTYNASNEDHIDPWSVSGLDRYYQRYFGIPSTINKRACYHDRRNCWRAYVCSTCFRTSIKLARHLPFIAAA